MNQKFLEKEYLKIYKKHSDAIFRHCYFRLYDRERAKDFMQEAFLRAWKYLAEGKDVENIRALVYKIANNLIIDDSRKKKEFSLELMQEAGFEPSVKTGSILEKELDAKSIIIVAKQIDEKHSVPFLMRYVDGLKPKEIAEILEIDTNNVSVRINRGLKEVKKILKVMSNQ